MENKQKEEDLTLKEVFQLIGILWMLLMIIGIMITVAVLTVIYMGWIPLLISWGIAFPLSIYISFGSKNENN